MSVTPTDTSGATPELQFEARIFPNEPWPVEILAHVELSGYGFEFTRRQPPLYKCRRLDHRSRPCIWVRADHLYILPNAPERSGNGHP